LGPVDGWRQLVERAAPHGWRVGTTRRPRSFGTHPRGGMGRDSGHFDFGLPRRGNVVERAAPGVDVRCCGIAPSRYSHWGGLPSVLDRARSQRTTTVEVLCARSSRRDVKSALGSSWRVDGNLGQVTSRCRSFLLAASLRRDLRFSLNFWRPQKCDSPWGRHHWETDRSGVWPCGALRAGDQDPRP
jgi:hypothetical protein